MNKTCYQCKTESKNLVEDPKFCPKCHRDWRTPTILQRLRGSIEGFQMKPKPFNKHEKNTTEEITKTNTSYQSQERQTDTRREEDLESDTCQV